MKLSDLKKLSERGEIPPWSEDHLQTALRYFRKNSCLGPDDIGGDASNNWVNEDEAHFICTMRNNIDKLIAVVEAAKELAQRMSPALRKPEIKYPADDLLRAIEALEAE